MRTPYSLTKGGLICFVLFLFYFESGAQVVPKRRAMELLRKNLRLTGFTQAELAGDIVTDAYADKRSGDFLVYLQQGYMGIPVYNKIGIYVFRQDSLVEKRVNFIPRLAVKIPKRSIAGGKPNFAVSGDDAARMASGHLAIPLERGMGRVRRKDMVWVQVGDTADLRLSWNVRISTDDGNNDWYVRVDAQTGEVLSKSSLIVSERARECEDRPVVFGGRVSSVVAPGIAAAGAVRPTVAFPMVAGPWAVTTASYFVYPFPMESANFGSRSTDTDPWLKAGSGNNATSLGWHTDNIGYYSYTRGNNVWAQMDTLGTNAPTGLTDTSLTASPALTFNRADDMSAFPTSYSNSRAGMDNLFYWNNIMHDISYQYGFDETSGNFQAYNQSRGGYGNDQVYALSLSGAGLDNSDFATPPDGENPTMRMFQWTSNIFTKLHVNAPAAISADYAAVEGQVSINNKLAYRGSLTGDVVQVLDAGGTHLGCGTISNAASVAGKIALIDRGSCNFTVKIQNAQNAGATGVIIVNSVSGSPYAMTGSQNTITIPAVMISLADGNTLKGNLTGLNGVMLSSGQYIDGSFDNGVIAHEYTHGISNRLTGGPANADCLYNAEQMGEGWSDYDALMVTTDWSTASVSDGPRKRTLGTFVMGQPATGPGIRTYPYSTDMTINPWRYDSVAVSTGGEVHMIGEIWCATLWDMTWNIIQQEGISADIYHGTKGNNIALQLVIQALKYQPCGPGFIDGRDAILKADSLLYNYAHKCAIWNAFARRGMGKSASEGNANSYTDQTPAYDLPSGVSLAQTVDKASPGTGDNVTYTINASCNCTPVSGVSIVDSLTSNLSFVAAPGGTYVPASGGNSAYVHFDGLSFTAGETKSFTVQAGVTGVFSNPDTLINDGQDPSNYSWTTTSITGPATFYPVTTAAHTGTHSWYAPDASVSTDFALVTGNLLLDTVSTLSFWHRFETDATYDGGVVEITTDGGAHWQDLGPYMTQNGYNSNIALLAGNGVERQGFSGSSGGVFIQTVISLTGFAGTTAKIRFRFTSDPSVGDDGWYLDDILLQNQKGIVSVANAYSGSGLLATKKAVSLLAPGPLPVNFLLFEAKKQGMDGWLHWRVNGELGVAKYVIERSGDGRVFGPVGEVAGSAAAAGDYTFTDGHPLDGDNFYRIVEYDPDGKATYSGIRLLQWSGSGMSIRVYPVPTFDHAVQLEIDMDQDAAVQASLVNMVGQVVGTYVVKRGSNRLGFGDLSRGIYFLKIQLAGRSPEVRKVVID